MSQKTTAKQARAIEALLTCPTMEQAADQAGVNRRTLTRWLDDQAFRAALTAAEDQALDRVARRLLAMADKALDAIENVIDNPVQPGAGNKRLAAQTALDQLSRITELRNLEARLERLEKELIYAPKTTY